MTIRAALIAFHPRPLVTGVRLWVARVTALVTAQAPWPGESRDQPSPGAPGQAASPHLCCVISRRRLAPDLADTGHPWVVRTRPGPSAGPSPVPVSGLGEAFQFSSFHNDEAIAKIIGPRPTNFIDPDQAGEAGKAVLCREDGRWAPLFKGSGSVRVPELGSRYDDRCVGSNVS